MAEENEDEDEDIVCVHGLSGDASHGNDILICEGAHSAAVGWHQLCKPLLSCLNMFGISSAKGTKGNRTDLPHFRMVGLFPQPLAQHRRGSNIHNLQVLRTFFSQQLFGTYELTTRLHNRVIQKPGNALQ